MADRWRCGRCGAARHRVMVQLNEPTMDVPGGCVRGCDDLGVRLGWRDPPSPAYPHPGDLIRWRDA